MSRSFFPFLLACLFFVCSATAQESGYELGVKVTALLSETDGTLDLERAILSEFRDGLKARNIPESGHYQKIVLIDAREIEFGDQKRIVLSISEMDALPEQVLARGAKDEFFYLQAKMVKRTAYPAEGKFIREFVSREWMEQFWSVRDQALFVIAPDELERTVSEYVDHLVSE